MRRLLLITLALAGIAVPATAAPATFFARPSDGRLVSKPRTLEFRDLDLTKIRWTGWGNRTARGTATASSLQCTPSCAAGRRVRTTATLRMSRRRTVKGKRVYQCLTGTIAKGDVRRIEWPPGCAR